MTTEAGECRHAAFPKMALLPAIALYCAPSKEEWCGGDGEGGDDGDGEESWEYVGALV